MKVATVQYYIFPCSDNMTVNTVFNFVSILTYFVTVFYI